MDVLSLPLVFTAKADEDGFVQLKGIGSRLEVGEFVADDAAVAEPKADREGPWFVPGRFVVRTKWVRCEMRWTGEALINVHTDEAVSLPVGESVECLLVSRSIREILKGLLRAGDPDEKVACLWCETQLKGRNMLLHVDRQHPMPPAGATRLRQLSGRGWMQVEKCTAELLFSGGDMFIVQREGTVWIGENPPTVPWSEWILDETGCDYMKNPEPKPPESDRGHDEGWFVLPNEEPAYDLENQMYVVPRCRFVLGFGETEVLLEWTGHHLVACQDGTVICGTDGAKESGTTVH